MIGRDPIGGRRSSRTDNLGRGQANRQATKCHLKSQAASSLDLNEQLPIALSIPEAAKMLGISKSLAYELAARGELRTLRLGRRIVVPRTVVIDLLNAA